jgi:hypothetical protein
MVAAPAPGQGNVERTGVDQHPAVTLNLTLLTAKAIHQAADFRLFDLRTRAVVPDPSTKRLTLSYLNWNGSVTYAGIGRTRHGRTADIAQRWLAGLNEPSFTDVAEVLSQRGTAWLRSLGLPRQQRRHTFVLTGFVEGIATAAVISNHRRWQGQEIGIVEDRLGISTIRVRGRHPRLIVTGLTNSVTALERRWLLHLAPVDPWNGVRLRAALARVNREAAWRFPKYISEDCYLSSQDRSGRVSEGVSGETPARPAMLFQGVDMVELAREVLDEHFGPGNWSVRQSTFAPSRPGRTVEVPPCIPEPVVSSRAFDLVQLAMPSGGRGTGRAVNGLGVVVRSGAEAQGGPDYPCMWRDPSHVTPLTHLGGLGGEAHGINEAGDVVGQCDLPDRSTHALVWRPDGRVDDIGAGVGYLSGARAISAYGEIAGWVGVHPTERGQAHFRPAIWMDDATPAVFSELGGRWGEATGVSAAGIVFGFVYDRNQAAVWLRLTDGTATVLAPEGCRSFWANGVTRDGKVIGMCLWPDGRRGVGLTDLDGRLESINIPGFELGAVGDDGEVLAGRQESGTVTVPAIWRRGDRETEVLPHLRNHHHAVFGLSWPFVVGVATADRCSHPLLWQAT